MTDFQFDLHFHEGDDDAAKAAAQKAADEAKAAADKAAADAKIAADKANETVSKEYADRLRRQAEAAEKKAKELQDQIDAANKKKLEEDGEFKKLADEAEKRAKKAEDAAAAAQQRVADREVRTALRELAREAGIVNPKIAELIKADDVTYDAGTDRVTGAKEAVAAFKAENPDLFAKELTPEEKKKAEEEAKAKAAAEARGKTYIPPGATGEKTGGKGNVYDLDDEAWAKLKRTDPVLRRLSLR